MFSECIFTMSLSLYQIQFTVFTSKESITSPETCQPQFSEKVYKFQNKWWKAITLYNNHSIVLERIQKKMEAERALDKEEVKQHTNTQKIMYLSFYQEIMILV